MAKRIVVVNDVPPTPEIDEELVEASIPDGDGTVWVTPEMAALWLTRNKNNRPLRKARVNTLARDMAMDAWHYTGEPIKFSEVGRHMDGQHRLEAVVKSGKTVKMMVVVGLEEESQAFMDAGAKRTAADALSFKGERNVYTLAAACRFGIQVTGKRLSGREVISNAEVMAWLEEHPDIRRYVNQSQNHAKHLDLKPSVMAYALWKMHEVDAEDAAVFLKDLVHLRSTGIGDPVYTLLARLRTAKRQREYISPLVELNFITKAWNARRAGIGLRSLRVPVDETEILEFK